jgi:hypothetical protein
MLHPITFAVLKPFLGITLIAATAVSALHFASPAPTTSSAATTTTLHSLKLQRFDSGSWTDADSGAVSDSKFLITGTAGEACGSYDGILAWAYANTDWVNQNYPGYAGVFLAPTPVACPVLCSGDVQVEMPNVVVGSTQFQNFCTNAENAATGDLTSGCQTYCGVHDFLQPMLWPSPWTGTESGVVEFSKYARWGTPRQLDFRGAWSQNETPHKFFSMMVFAANCLARQSAETGTALPNGFFDTQPNVHPSFRDLVMDGDLHLVFQVVSLQGDGIVPSEFPTTDDPVANLQGPPGLVFHPSTPHCRTSNAIYFDLMSGVGGDLPPASPLYDAASEPPQNHPIITVHKGGTGTVNLAPYSDGTDLHFEKQGSPSLVLHASAGPDFGSVNFTWPSNSVTGTFFLTSITYHGQTVTLTGTNTIAVIVLN